MNPQSEESEGGNFSGVSRPRAWLTRAQLDHSENYTGSPQNRARADAIRVAEQIGSDGMVRALPGRSISYQESLRMLGMVPEYDDILSRPE